MSFQLSDAFAIVQAVYARVKLVHRNKAELYKLNRSMETLLETFRSSRIDSADEAISAYHDALEETINYILGIQHLVEKHVRHWWLSFGPWFKAEDLKEEIAEMRQKVEVCCRTLQMKTSFITLRVLEEVRQFLKTSRHDMDEVLRRIPLSPPAYQMTSDSATAERAVQVEFNANRAHVASSTTQLVPVQGAGGAITVVPDMTLGPATAGRTVKVETNTNQAHVASSTTQPAPAQSAGAMTAVQEEVRYERECRYSNGTIELVPRGRESKSFMIFKSMPQDATCIQESDNSHVLHNMPSKFGKDIAIRFHVEGPALHRTYIDTGAFDTVFFVGGEDSAEAYRSARAWYDLLLSLHSRQRIKRGPPPALAELVTQREMQLLIRNLWLHWRPSAVLNDSKYRIKWENKTILGCSPSSDNCFAVWYLAPDKPDGKRWCMIKVLGPCVIRTGGLQGRDASFWQNTDQHTSEANASRAWQAELDTLRRHMQQRREERQTNTANKSSKGAVTTKRSGRG